MNGKSAVECALAGDDFLGETPVWSVREQALYWINCENPPRISRFDPAGGAVKSWPMPERVGAIALRADGRLLVALARGVYDFDPKSGELKLRARSDLPENLQLHEGKCDRQGRFWIGTINRDYVRTGALGGGMFLRLQDNRLLPMIPEVTVANGLGWSPDGTVMYRADSMSGKVSVHPYDCAAGVPGPGRTFSAIAESDGIPDGAAVDAEGCYWLTLFRGGRLRRYRPDGVIASEMPMPVGKPTMLAFGGADLSTVYVTSARFTRPKVDPREPELGGLFRLTAGVRGLAEPFFEETA